MNRKVLVLGGSARSGLTVVRSLGRKGIQVHLGWCPLDSIATFSRYTTKAHILPEYREGDSHWLSALIEVLEREKFDLVIPTSDGSMLPLIKKRSTLERIVKLAIPSDEAFFCAYRKNETVELCRRLQVPIPRQIVVSSQEGLSELDSGWNFPLVIKPVSSKIIMGTKIVEVAVTYANSKGELFSKLKSILPVTAVLIQEYFAGIGVGVELLADGGKILCVFQHERVHEPIYGGGSTYRKSTPLNLKLLNCTEKLISALKWTGVAMAEFKYNKSTDEFALIEINGRFWGSLPLAVAAGMDFPYYLYEFLVEGRKQFDRSYKIGIYCRNLRADFGWFRQNLVTRPSKYNNALPLWELLPEVFNIMTMRERSDTFVSDDLRPGFKEIGFIFRKIRNKLHRIFLKCWLALPQAKNLQQKRIRRRSKRARISICFVCKGNICRSPFAEFYLEKI